MTGPSRGERPPAPEPLPHPVVDNHCHLDISPRDGDREASLAPAEAIAAAAAVGVTRIVQIGCDLPGARWAVEAAAEHGVYVVLDLQPGRQDFLSQAQQYQELLELPNVGLALDPEWRLGPDQVADYAERKGWTLTEAERWLSPNLGYDPED